MKKTHKKKLRGSLFSFRKFIIFFITYAFVVTCCILLFVNSMQLDSQILKGNAPLTFGNIVLLTLIFTVIDEVRRRYTIKRPVEKILDATDKITKGDFSVRIENESSFNSDNEFDAIIDGYNKMAEELAGVETLKTDFISNVSHELKTPLAVIQNYGTMLMEENLAEEKRIEYAKIVTQSSSQLASLITNILKLNKLENQQIFPKTKVYNLSEQICECMLMFENVWEKKNLDINTQICDEVMIKCDDELLSLVWNNLFSNAFKFTDDGGKISVSCKLENGWANVKISDTGCGMTADVGKHIFEKFYQGDPSHKTNGNGLGLALVKRVIDIVQGEIFVESTLGEGTTFTVKIKQGIEDDEEV